jgi:hypothetical protein
MTGNSYTVNTDSLAVRVGELRSLVGAVQAAADTLDLYGGEFGPGDLSGAMSDVADHWRDGLGKIGDHIDTMADNVKGAVDNYQTLEDSGRQRFAEAMETRKDQQVRQAQFDQLPYGVGPKLGPPTPPEVAQRLHGQGE